MSESITTGGKRLRVDKPGAAPQLVLWKHLLPLLRTLFRRVGIDLQIDGAHSSSNGVDGAISFKINQQSAASTFPFQCPAFSGTGSVVVSGSVNGVPVTGGDSIDIGSDDKVFIKATLTLTISTDNYVQKMTASAYELDSAGSVPDDTSTHAYFLVADYTGGSKSGQYVVNSLTMRAKDDGTGTSTPDYIWGSL